MNPFDDSPLVEVVKAHHGDLSVEDAGHLEMLLEAFDIYRVRNEERDSVWRRSGVKGHCVQMMAKIDRAFSQVMRGEDPNPDHFIDLINYAVFALRQLNDPNGDWPWQEN